MRPGRRLTGTGKGVADCSLLQLVFMAQPAGARSACLRARTRCGRPFVITPAVVACLQVAVLRSAVKLEQEQQFLIAKKLQELTGSKNIKLKPVVDPELVAGFVVEYGEAGRAGRG